MARKSYGPIQLWPDIATASYSYGLLADVAVAAEPHDGAALRGVVAERLEPRRVVPFRAGGPGRARRRQPVDDVGLYGYGRIYSYGPCIVMARCSCGPM